MPRLTDVVRERSDRQQVVVMIETQTLVAAQALAGKDLLLQVPQPAALHVALLERGHRGLTLRRPGQGVPADREGRSGDIPSSRRGGDGTPSRRPERSAALRAWRACSPAASSRG